MTVNRIPLQCVPNWHLLPFSFYLRHGFALNLRMLGGIGFIFFSIKRIGWLIGSFFSSPKISIPTLTWANIIIWQLKLRVGILCAMFCCSEPNRTDCVELGFRYRCRGAGMYIIGEPTINVFYWWVSNSKQINQLKHVTNLMYDNCWYVMYVNVNHY